MTLSDLPNVRDLSAREKLELVDELWLSVASELDALEVPDEAKTVLDDRWTAFLKNPASAFTLEQFQERLRAARR